MDKKLVVLLLFCTVVSSLFGTRDVYSRDLLSANKYTEKEKIELLLESIKSLKDVKFERNGSIHEVDAAFKLMKSKLNKVGVENITAKEFIDKIASKSSTSGQPYYIIYPNGKKIPACDFLKKKLNEIESQP